MLGNYQKHPIGRNKNPCIQGSTTKKEWPTNPSAGWLLNFAQVDSQKPIVKSTFQQLERIFAITGVMNYITNPNHALFLWQIPRIYHQICKCFDLLKNRYFFHDPCITCCYQKVGVSENSGFPPQIIHFNRVFHDFHHPFWGPTPIFGVTPKARCPPALKNRHFNAAPLDVLVVMPGVKVFVDANLLDPWMWK